MSDQVIRVRRGLVRQPKTHACACTHTHARAGTHTLIHPHIYAYSNSHTRSHAHTHPQQRIDDKAEALRIKVENFITNKLEVEEVECKQRHLDIQVCARTCALERGRARVGA